MCGIVRMRIVLYNDGPRTLSMLVLMLGAEGGMAEAFITELDPINWRRVVYRWNDAFIEIAVLGAHTRKSYEH